jgi:hypothetical protein
MPTEIALRRRPRRRLVIVLVVVFIITVLAFVAIWVGVRGMMARSELSNAAPLAHAIEAAAIAGRASGT